MYSRNDPRLRRTLNQISQNLEQANESAQVGLFSVHEHYLKPCLSSFSNCFDQCTGAVIPRHDDRSRRARARARLPPEYSFDFYDDWEEDENAALLGAEEDELEPEPTAQPKKRVFMNYGSASMPAGPRRSLGDASDPTLIPGPSYFGLFSGLPFIAGKRALRYHPSAENLQERPQGRSAKTPGERDILEEDDFDEDALEGGKEHRSRIRSGTVASGHTEDSMSSRGDIFPSDDEDDAVPLGDEFDMSFDAKGDDGSSGKKKGRRRSHGSRKSSYSSKRLSESSRANSTAEMSMSPRSVQDIERIPELAELQRQEQEVQAEEEEEIERRRAAAQDLARKRGLGVLQGEKRPSAAPAGAEVSPAGPGHSSAQNFSEPSESQDVPTREDPVNAPDEGG